MEFEIKEGECKDCFLTVLPNCKDVFKIILRKDCRNLLTPHEILVKVEKWVPCTKENIKVGDEVKYIQNKYDRFKILFIGDRRVFVKDLEDGNEYSYKFDKLEVLK